MPSEVVYLTNACVHSKTKSCSWMSEQTGMFMKQIQIFFPILEDFAIQQEWEGFFPTTSKSSICCVHFLKSLLLS